VPQYGGTLTIRALINPANFDPYNSESLFTVDSGWMERLIADDWTLDPSVFNYTQSFRPSEYCKGYLASSWEFTDLKTYVIYLNQGIHWQNKAPVNGREFTSADVVYHFDRLFGLGGGFTTRDPFMTYAGWNYLTSVAATDKYTITFKWSVPNPEFITECMDAQSAGSPCIEASEVVQQYGNLNDWHNAVGTGPFILSDFVSGSSVTLIKNPNYWGYDERYPKNQLPYLNQINMLIIPDDATAMAGLRSGKIDVLDGMQSMNATALMKTTPTLTKISVIPGNAFSIAMRIDKAPFTDIRVREALQKAIDLPTIAKTFYNGDCSPNPSTLSWSGMGAGWGLPYDQWPQDLKDSYVYNPTQAKQLLSDAGYPNGFNTDLVADSSSDMSLLQIIKSYFAAIGVNMPITVKDSASWTAYVQTQHLHDAMACRGTGQLAQIYEPIRQLNNFRTGYSTNGINMVNDPTWDAFFTNAMAATTTSDVQKIVAQANEYVAQQHWVISLLLPNVYALYWPWLKGYQGEYSSISGQNLGPQLLGFYGARFWIDLNLKKSMGY
jgi:peptide/nickel transport system substrate-binding protein